MTTLILTIAAGLLIGVALGALGGGGSILAVPVLLFVLDQDPGQATTGALVVVGVTALAGAVTAYRNGTVLLARGITFGLAASAGAVAGALVSPRVPDPILLGAFSLLMLVVATKMLIRQRHHSRSGGPSRGPRPRFDDPIITFSPTFACACPRALKLLVTATVVGALTGLLGVGGGFLIVPALALALAVPPRYAAGTALVVITMTSTVALVTRAGGSTPHPEWTAVIVLTTVSVLAAVIAGKAATRVKTDHLSTAFAYLTLGVALWTGFRAVSELV